MDIEVLYIADCPNVETARAHVAEAIARAGVADAAVRERVVTSPEEASRHGMSGSPTILIDGRDPFASSSVVPSLACRLYRAGAATAGSPSVEQLLAVLSA